MRSRRDVRLLGIVALTALLAAAASRTATAQPPVVIAEGETPRPDEIARAVDIVKADPNLSPERTIKSLRWKGANTTKSGTPGWLKWIAGFFDWLARSARVLVWCTALVLAGMLVVYIVRLFATHVSATREEPVVAPTHVRDLDIRPETLPPDVGAAARTSWDRGEHRAALALLYRGLLSRLVHVHRLSIRDSSTEGDCLTLVAAHLTAARRDYSSLLITTWQRFVYGREDVGSATVYALCDSFAATLDLVDRDPVAIKGAA